MTLGLLLSETAPMLGEENVFATYYLLLAIIFDEISRRGSILTPGNRKQIPKIKHSIPSCQKITFFLTILLNQISS